MSPDLSRPAVASLSPAQRRVRAFRAADAFVVEAYRLTTVLEGTAGRDLAREIRSVVARCGGALVAASVSTAEPSGERRWLVEAHQRLAEGRYYLYLARRLGFIDVTRYRALMARHDAAHREIDLAIGDVPRAEARARDPA